MEKNFKAGYRSQQPRATELNFYRSRAYDIEGGYERWLQDVWTSLANQSVGPNVYAL